MPPSPVQVEMPQRLAAMPSARLAWTESAPKLMPAIMIGRSRTSGLSHAPSPITTRVSHFSR